MIEFENVALLMRMSVFLQLRQGMILHSLQKFFKSVFSSVSINVITVETKIKEDSVPARIIEKKMNGSEFLSADGLKCNKFIVDQIS